MGPLVMGLILDAMGGAVTVSAWGVGFAHVAVVMLIGLAALWLLDPRDPGRTSSDDPPRGRG